MFGRGYRATALLMLGLTRISRGDPCVPSTGQSEVEIGEPTTVCLVLNQLIWDPDGINAFYSQIVITPEADDFSRIRVPSSWESDLVRDDKILGTYGPDVGMHVESMGKISFQKAFRLSSEGKTFPLFTAIVDVDNGKVTGITWDDGCHFCNSNHCQENTYDYSTGNLTASSFGGKDCFWEDDSCLQGSTGSISDICQLTVYVVWTGSDKNGNYFTSFSKRLSTFAGQAISEYIDSAESTYETYAR